MAFFGAAYWFTPLNCLDNEFDAPDSEADNELCCAIAEGKAGLHPDAWGNHDPLSVLPGYWPVWSKRRRPALYKPPVDRRVTPLTEAEIRRYVEAQARRPTPIPPELRRAGELELTCDECRARYGGTLLYYDGKREGSVEAIRKLGAVTGWTCIEGRDLCPDCSVIPPSAIPRKRWRRLRLK